ncbi:MAG: DNA replication/repair protein RecF [Anaerolineales bacterium]|jgi:DNA replication and repair protein RecF
MPLIRFECKGVRRLEPTAIEPHGQLNLVVGANASGKTSLLEALYILGSGKSFRSNHLEKVVQHGCHEFVLFGLMEEQGRETRLGYHRMREGREIHIDGAAVNVSAELAYHLPIQAVTPDTHFAFLHQAGARRSTLDWALFHVEPSFFPAWTEYRRVLRQRNAALKEGRRSGGHRVWDESLIRLGETIHGMRHDLLLDLAPRTTEIAQEILGIEGLSIRLRAGWRRDRSLAEALVEDGERDREAGYTHSGPHRADIEIHIGDRDARQEASQGQWKAVVLSLRMAQLGLFAERSGRKSVLLLDDLPAELDATRRRAVLDQLQRMPAQVFATATEAEQLETGPAMDHSLFHVEQGRVRKQA